MKNHILAGVALCAAIVSPVQAAGPVGSVSGEGVEISGSRMPAKGVSTWPLAANDNLYVNSGSALVTLNDGSKLVLGQGTRLVLSKAGKSVGLRVMSGQAYYKLSTSTAASIAGLSNAPVPAEVKEGLLAVEKEQVKLTLPLSMAALQQAAVTRNYATTVSPVRITPLNLGQVAAIRAQEITPSGPQPVLPPPSNPGAVPPVSPGRPADGNPNITIP